MFYFIRILFDILFFTQKYHLYKDVELWSNEST